MCHVAFLICRFQLKRLDAQLAASFESLEAQKLHATKWMNQQNVRIMVQAEETAPARVPMAAFFVINMKLQRALNDLTPSS